MSARSSSTARTRRTRSGGRPRNQAPRSRACSATEPRPDCLVCRQVVGGATGGLLIDAPLIAAFHVEPLPDRPAPLLGHVLISPRRHVAGLEDLDPREAAAVGVAMSRIARALKATFDVERVYSAVVGHHVPHLHVHVYPRYTGTPADVSWAASDEWEGAPRGGAAEIAEVADRLRTCLT